jgi:sugar/nucleoside kinase (ribokinase family)
MKALSFLFIFLIPVSLTYSYHVIGIGSPCVDLIYNVDDDFLKSTSLNKGDGQYASNWNSFSSILEKGDQLGSFKGMATGGSASNTIKGLSCLQNKTALLGKLGSDPSGLFYRKVAENLNIHLLAETSKEPTMQVAIFVTEDHQRTFFAYLGSSFQIPQDTLSKDLFKDVQLVHFDGYVIDEFSFDFTERAMKLAKASGAKVSIDLGCSRVAKMYRKEILYLLQNYTDVVFGNESEVEALFEQPASEGCCLLSKYCPVAVTLKGDQGACISSQGQMFLSPASDAIAIDTTGAGDLFASGFLHGYLKGYSLEDCAWIGNLLGGTIVSVVGAEIPEAIWPSLIGKIEKKIRETSSAKSPS